MFTGIVECVATLCEKHSSGNNLHLSFKSSMSSSLHIDQSIAHNGVCLTIVAQHKDTHTVTAIPQTLSHTNLAKLQTHTQINLERALGVDSRLEGHWVLGHIDTTLRCVDIQTLAKSWCFSFLLKDLAHRRWLIEKGAICINGVSLTVHNLLADQFSVSIIPHTYERTNFSILKVGDEVNVEFDVLGKYVENFYTRR